jgi:hypothetical protein
VVCPIRWAVAPGKLAGNEITPGRQGDPAAHRVPKEVAAMNQQVFDPFLYRALRKVARGEIGSTSEKGALRHRSQDLSPRMVSSLFVLHRDGLVKLDSAGANPRGGWITAELARDAVRLLEDWQQRLATAAFHDAPATR